VDIFSLKGGVGKTTLAVLLAKAQAQVSGRPVLIVDADLTGTCVGDVLQGWASPGWHEVEGLAHLVCGPPELLSERLIAPPLYVPALLPDGTPARVEPRRWSEAGERGALLFCPSHAEPAPSEGVPLVAPAVLNALLGHESGARWIAQVIERLIESAERVTGGLGGALVDHGPGMGALQRGAFADLAQPATPTRRGLFVTSCDAVDLLATHKFDEATRAPERASLVWCVNRVGSIEAGWQTRHCPSYVATNGGQKLEAWQIMRFGGWYEQALPLPSVDTLATANAAGSLDSWVSSKDPAVGFAPTLEALRARLFDDVPAHAQPAA
jgi:hypothetical protein